VGDRGAGHSGSDWSRRVSTGVGRQSLASGEYLGRRGGHLLSVGNRGHSPQGVVTRWRGIYWCGTEAQSLRVVTR
jgi:hypothetical protein